MAALSRASEELAPHAQQLLRDDLLTPVRIIISVLLNEIAACDRQVFLVLDDCDRLTSKAIRALVLRLLRYALENFHVLLGGRSEPALALGQFHANARLLRIDAADLRFSNDGAHAFFQQMRGVPLDRPSAALLNEATEGWVAGLQLASLALHEAGDATQVARGLAGARSGIDTYLEDTVLASLPAPMLKFLLRTSILDRLNAGACDALMGEGARSWEKLDWLERHNVFIQPLDAERQWFRYHALLSEVLRRRLARQGKGELKTLHRRASQWFAGQSLWPEAVKHALAAGDTSQAGQWVENCAMAMVDHSDMRTLLGWIAKLPADLVHERLRLRLAKAWALALSLQTREAAREVESIAEEIARADSGTTPSDEALPAEINAVRAVIAGFDDDGRHALALGRAAIASAAASALPAAPWVNHFAETAQIFGLLYEGDFDQVRRIRALATSHSGSVQTPVYANVYRECMFGLAALLQGDSRDAMHILETALGHAESMLDRHSAAVVLPAGYLSSSYYERDDLTRVREIVSGRAAIAMETCPLGGLLRYMRSVARLHACDGDIGSALAVIEDARQVAAARRWLRLRVGCDAEAVRLYLREGRLAKARQIAEALRVAMPGQRKPGVGIFLETWADYCITRTRVLIADGHAGQAVEGLEALRGEVRAAGRWYLDALVSILFALALEQHAEPDRALASFEQTLKIAQSTGMISGFADEGEKLRIVMERWRRTAPDAASFDVAFIDRLAAAFDSRASHAGTASPALSRVASDRLSAREVEILDHIARGLSNKEIGRALRVAPETLKWHLKNIFEKLNVSSRIEAVRSGLVLTRSP
ncbi:LuxR C-terminal-related transcriptional regulator [Burkholderia cepacia]|uniref:LuxR C-terminal-related transcriptional regulator n=1 Tax=Burkholderia cepacia TaxID=292 RepID=UPI000AD9E3C9|nr:LuxR C-terminal-related transcriptional regulator [Burkholderia cepacia]